MTSRSQSAAAVSSNHSNNASTSPGGRPSPNRRASLRDGGLMSVYGRVNTLSSPLELTVGANRRRDVQNANSTLSAVLGGKQRSWMWGGSAPRLSQSTTIPAHARSQVIPPKVRKTPKKPSDVATAAATAAALAAVGAAVQQQPPEEDAVPTIVHEQSVDAESVLPSPAPSHSPPMNEHRQLGDVGSVGESTTPVTTPAEGMSRVERTALTGVQAPPAAPASTASSSATVGQPVQRLPEEPGDRSTQKRPSDQPHSQGPRAPKRVMTFPGLLGQQANRMQGGPAAVRRRQSSSGAPFEYRPAQNPSGALQTPAASPLQSPTHLPIPQPQPITNENAFGDAQITHLTHQLTQFSSLGGFSPMEVSRLQLLSEALNKRDWVFMALHQYYALQMTCPAYLCQRIGFNLQSLQQLHGWKVLPYLIDDNKNLTQRCSGFFDMFPFPANSLTFVQLGPPNKIIEFLDKGCKIITAMRNFYVEKGCLATLEQVEKHLQPNSRVMLALVVDRINQDVRRAHVVRSGNTASPVPQQLVISQTQQAQSLRLQANQQYQPQLQPQASQSPPQQQQQQQQQQHQQSQSQSQSQTPQPQLFSAMSLQDLQPSLMQPPQNMYFDGRHGVGQGQPFLPSQSPTIMSEAQQRSNVQYHRSSMQLHPQVQSQTPAHPHPYPPQVPSQGGAHYRPIALAPQNTPAAAAAIPTHPAQQQNFFNFPLSQNMWNAQDMPGSPGMAVRRPSLQMQPPQTQPITRHLVPPQPGVTAPVYPQTNFLQAHLASPTMSPKVMSPKPGSDEKEKPPDLYMSIVGFAVKWLRLGFACQSKVWNMSPEAEKRLSRPLPPAQPHEPRKRAMVVPGSVICKLRCIEVQPGQTEPATDSEWVVKETTWPKNIFIEVNGKRVELRRKSQWGKDLPVDITDLLQAGTNRLDAVCLHNDENGAPKYLLSVEVYECMTGAGIRERLQKTARLDPSVTKAEIERRLSGGGVDGDDDLIISSSTVSVDVFCPFDYKLVRTPVRSKSCRHLECFDFDNYVNSRPRRRPNEPPHEDQYRCPLCGADARPLELILDGFFEEVVAKLRADFVTQGKDVKSVTLLPGGNWEAKVEKDEPLPGSRDTSTAPEELRKDIEVICLDD